MVILPSGKLQTGDSVSSHLVTYQITAPDDLWIQDALIGLLYSYCSDTVWYQGLGEVPVYVAVEVFSKIWDSFTLINVVGSILLYAGTAIPANCLACDGASYLRTDYPLLFAAIGTAWGAADSSHFNVPDLRGRAIVGSGTGSGLSPRALADTGGEETHTLVLAETPSHFHNVTGAAANATTIGPGAPEPTAVPAPVVTSSAGSDGAHNNMQPFGVLNYAIIAS